MKTLFVLSLLVALLLLAALPSFSVFGQAPALSCGYNQVTANLLNRSHQQDWAAWIRQLSGADYVLVAGQQVRITTRHTYAMENDTEHAQAIPYLVGQLEEWYPSSSIEVEYFSFIDPSTLINHTSRNVIVTIPGKSPSPLEVLFTAHLDSTSSDPKTSPLVLAPGAEDNASGSAALLEAARLLRNYRFNHTIKLIWFTGEEQGLFGSKAYTQSHDLSQIIGVVNMDMFGYDSNDDRCFELHIGELEASNRVGQCFIQGIDAYQLGLSYDYLSGPLGEGKSDHEPFWDRNVGAIEILEDYSYQNLESGCQFRESPYTLIGDRNPHYHKPTDTIDKLNLDTGFRIAQAGMAAVAGLAGPTGDCYSVQPKVDAEWLGNQMILNWASLAGSDNTRIYRSADGCQGPWEQVATTQAANQWVDPSAVRSESYAYQIEVFQSGQVCTSVPSPCEFVLGPDIPGLFRTYFPSIQ